MGEFSLTGELSWWPASSLPDEVAAREIVAGAVGCPVEAVQVKSIAFPAPLVDGSAQGDRVPRLLRSGFPVIEFTAVWLKQ